MTITPKHVRAQIAASSGVLDSLSRRLPPAVHAARLWMLDPVPEGQEKREDAGVRAKGHISDPTAVAALRELGHSERIFELFEANLDTLKLCLANLTKFADDWSPILGERTRCHGGRTVDEWSDPMCHNWADTYTVTTGEERVRGDGLCSKCRSKRERWERKQTVA
jgi:hypothetical protein